MANFMYHIDRATGCPDISPDAILGVSERVLLDKISVQISRPSRAECPPYVVASPAAEGLSQQPGGARRTQPAAELGHQFVSRLCTRTETSAPPESQAGFQPGT